MKSESAFRVSHSVTRFSWLLVLTLLIAAFLRLWQIGSLPPGLHYDEAADTIIAQQIARGENAPIFVAAYTGKEVLFFYWAALWMKLIGPSVFAMRLAAALLGLLTVAVTYRAGHELLAGRQSPHTLAGRALKGADALDGGEGVALLATVFIATSFWHVLMSRLGFRSIGEPFLQALVLAALFRGLRLNRWRWIVIAGALIGLNLYTYLAARLFPVAIAAIFLYLIFCDRGQRRLRLTQWVVVALTALIAFAPLGAYFLNNPDAFFTRIQQVAPRADQANALIANILDALGMFFVSGDPYIRFNLPGRPLFTLAWGLLFIVGLIAAVMGVFRGRTLWRRTAYFSLIATTLIMLLPSALAVNEITPSNLRAIGMMPLVFVFPALGTWWLAREAWTRKRADGNKKSAFFRVLARPGSLVLVILVVGTLETAWTYFRVYVNDPQLYIQSDGDLADLARVLNRTDTHGGPVYIAALHYRHPTVAALSEKYSDVKWLASNRAVVLPNGSGYLFFSRLGLPDETWLRRFLPDSALIDEPVAPDGATNYRAYHLTSQPVVTPQVKLEVNFGSIIQLLGYDVEPPHPASQTGREQSAAESTAAPTTRVTLYWQVLNRPDRGDYSTFAQLRDARGFEWGTGGSFDYPSEQWTPGEIIVNRIDAPIAPGAPPGDYELRVGWFSPGTNQRLEVVAPDGGFGGTVARLSPISVTSVTTDESHLNIGARLDREVAPGLRLLGYTQETVTPRPGAPLLMTLFWQGTTALPDEAIALQLHGETTIPLTTTQPVQGAYPFGHWAANEIVADRYRVRVPFAAPPGKYALEVGVGTSEPIALGTIEVIPADRMLSEPPIEHRLDVKLGDAIELSGYHLDQTDQALTLTLVWHSLRSIDEDYTVFTHVLDRAGQQIGGKDNQPVNGAYPTSYWMPGEYVIDEYVIPVKPPDDFALEVGMYDPETGARLGETVRLK